MTYKTPTAVKLRIKSAIVSLQLGLAAQSQDEYNAAMLDALGSITLVTPAASEPSKPAKLEGAPSTPSKA